jgi:hypothetical protein
VCRVQSVGDFDGNTEKVLQFHGPTSNGVLEGFALQILHRDEASSVVLPNFVNRANVWVVQRGCSASLLAESFKGLCVF